MSTDPANGFRGASIARGLGRENEIRWPLKRSNELFELKYGKALVASARRPGDVPVYGTNGQTGTHDTALFQGPGVVVGRKGVGHLGVEWVDRDYWVIDTAYSLVPVADVDLKFAYYLVLHVGLDHLKHGTSNPSLTRDAFGAQLFPLPPMEAQRSIAATLGALDDKIESNQRSRDGLLALAAALFEEACEGSPQVVTVGDVAMFHNRRRVPLSSRERSERPGPYPYYGATGVFDFIDDFLFDQILVLVGEDGSVINPDGTPVTQYIWGKSWVNNHAHPLTGRGDVSTELLYLAIRSADARPIVTGAVQAKINMGNLKSLVVELPPAKKLPLLQTRLAELFTLYRQRTDESKMLADLRDTLLPELLSGRIRVQEAQEAVAEVSA